MEKKNETKTLTEMMTNIVTERMDYSGECSHELDVNDHAVNSTALFATTVNICYYVKHFPFDLSPASTVLRDYLKQFDLYDYETPFKLRNDAFVNDDAYINERWDQIKCFLRLLSCRGYPTRVVRTTHHGVTTTESIFKHFTITQISYDDFDEMIFSINMTYSKLRLLLSGDIEENPGPTTHSKPAEEKVECDQQKKINLLLREIAKLKKSQQKQQNFVQRQIELEKRDRKKNRELGADRKRHAQTLVSDTVNKIKDDVLAVCSDASAMAETAKAAGYIACNAVLPGAGTAAAAVVNGAKVSAAVNKLGPTIDLLQNVLTSLTGAAEELNKAFQIPQEYDLLGILISFVSICNSLKEKSLFLLTLYCSNLARQLGLTLDTLMSLMPSFETATPEASISFTSGAETRRVGQSLVTEMLSTASQSPELLPFAGFLSFLCGAFSLICTGTAPTPGEMTKHFANVGRAAQGFKALKDLFTWVFSYLSEIYYTTVYGFSVEEYNFMQNFPQMENLYAAAKLIETFEKTLVDSSAGIANQILTVNHELNEYHYQAARMNSRPNTQLVSSIQRRIKDQVEWATHSPARCHTIRNQPVALYLFGHPGVGKSVATEVFKSRIYRRYLAKDGLRFESTAFIRRAKNEYWEGYTGQPVVILDDFGNVKDSQQRPVEEYEELEYMVNTAQFPLKMAELKAKGVTNFVSEYIIASSNQKYPEIKSLVDPGAVFRRFHVWADVTIDPAYGVPIGKDETGNSYYTFDKATIAKLKGIHVDDVPPLFTEHYRFSCYKVIHNKQTGNAEVSYLPGMNSLKFEEFWDYYVKENDRRKKESVSLANAIRKEAGIDTPAAPATEQQIMDQFSKIFHPDLFVETLAAEESFGVKLEDEFYDAEEDSTFGSITHIFNLRMRLNKVKEMFEDYKNGCHSAFNRLWSRARACITHASNKMLSIAEFILAFFSSAAQKTIDYLPSVPTSKILAGVCSTAAALFGVWYTGIFCSKSVNDSNTWCKFNRAPSDTDTPCERCTTCNILQYPKRGNMLVHFLERSGIKSVRNDLLEQGMSRETLEDIREDIRRSYVQTPTRHPSSQCPILQLVDQNFVATTHQDALEVIDGKCWYDCSYCDQIGELKYNSADAEDCIRCANDMLSHRPTAQRVYDSQPRLVRPTNYAQRVYDSQPTAIRPRSFAQKVYENNPRMPRARRLAQGAIDCKTEVHIGSRKYAQRDQVEVEQTTKTLLANAVWIQAVDKAGRCSRSNGVFLVGRTMITTAHTVLTPPHTDPIEHLVIRNPYSTSPAIQVPIDKCHISQIYQLDGSPVDLALVSFPPVVPSRPKILPKFIGAKNIDMLCEGTLTFSGFYEINGKTVVQEKHPASFAVSTKRTEYYLHKPGQCPKDPDECQCAIEIGNHIDYDLETYSGMCGALLSVTNKLVHTKLIGFHVAGGPGVLALGVLTTQEFLSEALQAHVQRFKIPRSYLIDGRLPYSQSLVDTSHRVSLLDLGDCLNVGTAKSPAAPVVTQLAPSLVFDKVQQHIAKPAYLKPVIVEGEGLVDPMMKGLKKIMGGQTFVDPDLLEAAANDVFQCIGKPTTGRGIIHTYAEAITGVEGDPYKRPINRTTSPGYPYNLTNKSKGKTAWMGCDENYIVDNPALMSDVESLLSHSRNGVRGSAISIATLKDEKRPLEKVDAGKTRVFEACPQHLVIAIRQYFLDFTAHVMRNRIDNGIAVGINPFSLEWTKLAHRLQTNGDYMIAGDFSNFDGSLLLQILVKIMEKINDWYGDDADAQLTRAALWEHICNADILVRGEVIRKTHSQPSGNPLTVIINSIFNGIVMRIAYMLLKKEQGMPAVCDYRKYVTEIIYGDDDIKSVKREITSWFNQLTLTDALASFGLTYTDEGKTGIIPKFKPLVDVAFLKRKFVIQDDGTFLAPMDLENALEITNWIRGKALRTSTLENCEQAIAELALHPQHVYEHWSSRIQEELRKVGIAITVPTYFEQKQEYKSNRDGYDRAEYVPLW